MRIRGKVNPIKLETGLRSNSAGIPHTLLLRIEAWGFPTFGRLLYIPQFRVCVVPGPSTLGSFSIGFRD